MKIIALLYITLLSSCALGANYHRSSNHSADQDRGLHRNRNFMGGSPTHANESRKTLLDEKPNKDKRLVITSSRLSIEVSSTDDGVKMIETIVSALNGHIETQNNNRITIRIPAASFNDAIMKLEKIGIVTNKQISRKDVTARMRDDNIRLSNLLAMQKRLLSLIEKSDIIKDTLAIERELNRITEQIEIIKSTLKESENKIQLSTITIELLESRGWNRNHYSTPFAWAERVGMSIGQPVNRRSSKPRRWLHYDRPSGFVAWHEDRGITKLISADDSHIHISEHKNVDGGDLAFWSQSLTTHINNNQIRDISTEDIPAYSKHVAHIIKGTKSLNGKQYACSICIICTKRSVYIVEGWGPTKSFRNHDKELQALLTSMRVR